MATYHIRLPWWATLLLMPIWLMAFMLWFVIAMLLGLAALSVEGVRWVCAHAQRKTR